MTEDMPDRMSDRMPVGMPDKVPECLPDRMPEGMPDRMSDRMPVGMPDKVPECLPDRMREDLPDRMPDRMSEDMPEDMPDRVPEDMPEQIAEDMPARMPEDIPDRIPEDMPDKMPEGMSDRMAEDMPVIKCINVMVGITRSKVFFQYACLYVPSFFQALPLLHFMPFFFVSVYVFNYVHIYKYTHLNVTQDYPWRGAPKNSPGGAYSMQPAVQPAHGVMERAYRTSRVVCRCMQYLEGRVAGGSWKLSKEKITKYSLRKHTVWERLKDFVVFLDYFSKASSMRSLF